jgi:hypothetical protein
MDDSELIARLAGGDGAVPREQFTPVRKGV